jgi:hypothetical protein
MHTDWKEIIESCRAIPPESGAWDEIEDAILEFRALSAEKRALRKTVRDHLAHALVIFREKHQPLHGCLLPDSLFKWEVQEIEETTADESLRHLESLSAALSELAAIERGLTTASLSIRPAFRRQQADAEEKISHLLSMLEPNFVISEHGVPKDSATSVPIEGDNEEEESQGDEVETEVEKEEISTQPQLEVKRPTTAPARSPLDGLIIPALPDDDLRATDSKRIEPRHEATAPKAPTPAETVEPIPRVASTVGVALEVPIELSSYEDFRAAHWIQSDGRCVPAPWLADEFANRLANEAQAALKQFDFAWLSILGRAASERNWTPIMAIDEVESFAALWADPTSPVAGVAANRAERVRVAMEQGEGGEPRWQVAAFLEALRPSLEQPLNPADLETRILYESDILSHAVPALLRLQQGDTHAIERLKREGSRIDKPTQAQLTERLKQEREGFQELVRKQWSAADGRIKHSHCREAWKRFVEKSVDPLADLLRPSANSQDHTGWRLDSLRQHAQRLTEDHRQIANKYEAKFQDRARMDRAAREIAEAALRVVQAAGEWRAAEPGQGRSNQDLTPLRSLLESPPLDEPTEDACRLLFRRIVHGEGDWRDYPPRLTLRALVMRPWLASVFERQQLWSGGCYANPDVGNLDQSAVLRLAAGRLESPAVAADQLSEDEMQLLELLPTVLVRGLPTEILPWFLGAGIFPESEETRIHARQTEQQGELESRFAVLRSLWRDAEALCLPFAPQVDSVLTEANARLDDAAWLQREMPLFEKWLEAYAAFLRQDIADQCERLRHEAAAFDDETQAKVNAALEARRFSDALESLHRPTATTHDETTLRETDWRENATGRWSEPFRVLGEMRGALADGSTGEAELLELWLEFQPDRSRLRRAFYDFLSGETKDTPMLELRELKERTTIRLLLPAFLHRLEKGGLNPTFLPQLRRFGQIVLMSPQVAPTNPETYASNLLTTATNETAQQHLVVFLAPRVPPAARESAVRLIRSRGALVMLLDDLDLCRLLHARRGWPYSFLGLVEMAFEQMDWTRLQPFSTQDGQFIEPEMFVGRSQQAEELAVTTRHSRIFSGRKLGKSALLKHLEQSRSGKALPSGSILRVVYLNAAGAMGESALVDTILAGLESKLAFTPPGDSTGSPVERLTGALTAWTQAYPRESLLLILDEADEFVLAQIEGYDLARERSLSFAMMKSIPEQRHDSRGFPRVRFILSGYRATNSDKAVWVNAGEVLRLNPLTEDEAMHLIAGPLARLNVDAAEQAPAIARRCGYQPAVLLRFGETLLQHLQDHVSKTLRGRVQVVGKHVAEVFNSPRVQEEIRTVVNNNFHGNPAHAVIFDAMLLCLRRLPPGTWLESATQKILTQLTALDPETDWMRALDADETAVVTGALRDFRVRYLVRLDDESADGSLRCQLRFPHYLPVLTRDVLLESAIRQRIAALRVGGPQARAVSGMLPAHDFDELRRQSKEAREPEWPLCALVAAGHWQAALQHEYGGVPDRLGFTSAEIVVFDELPAPGATLPRGPVLAASPETLARYAEASPTPEMSPPVLIGDAELLRAAVRAELTDEPGPVVAYGLHRVNHPRLSWWFERLRGWQFASSESLPNLLAATSGIPLLVGMADDFLAERLKPGADVSGEVFKQLETLLSEAPANAANLLKDGPASVRLLPRERELLRMAVTVAQNTSGYPKAVTFGAEKELRNDWELYRECLPAAAPLTAGLDDQVALRFLRLGGLLPLDATGLLRFRDNDALFRLALLL